MTGLREKLVFYYEGTIIVNSYMIKRNFVLLILSLITLCSGQSGKLCMIEGMVTDLSSGEPVQLVNVYLSGTTFGASTSQTGLYSIENIPGGTYQLIFQHVGYEVKIHPIEIGTDLSYEMNMHLQPRVYEGESIQVITSKPEEWLEQLNFFKKQFIGESHNAKICEIFNPEVLNFELDPEYGEFTAHTDSIVHIVNYALGYQIYLVLGDFLCKNEQLSHYLIYPRFESLEPADEEQMEEWVENRRKTYKGSFKHFLSALARGKLAEEYFQIVRSDEITPLIHGFGKSVNGQGLDIMDMGPLYKKFYLTDYLKIWYSPRELFPPSIIKFELNYIMIDTLGNVLTPWSVKHSGAWYKKRIADTLPMEYMPNQQVAE